MTSFGERLREEREARGVSLEELADAVKVGTRYLSALEQDDFQQLPEDVFTKGFVRAYAGYIGSDPEVLVTDYLRERRRVDGKIATGNDADVIRELSRVLHVHDSPSRVGRLARAMLGPALVLGGAAVGVWLVLDGSEPEPPLPPASVASNPVEPARALPTESPNVAPARDVKPAAAPGVEERSSSIVAASVVTPPPAERAEPSPPPEIRIVRNSPDPTPAVSQEPTIARSLAPLPFREIVPEPETEAETEAPVLEAPLAPVDPAVEEAPTLNVPDFGVGTAVVDRRLVGESDRFEVGQRVWFWTRVLGGEPGDTISHAWIRNGRVVETIELRVGASHWRTQSRKSFWEESSGAWAVEARDTLGRVLARSEFDVVAAAP